ncbi:MAG: Lrp/AsnC family transcriptional regulator [Methanobacteriota archaeon]
MSSLDALDERILALLKENARASYTDIAARLGLSEGAVRQRMKRLLEGGVIRRFTIETRGRALKALLEIRTEVNVDSGRLAEKILALSGVSRVYEVAGETDLVAVLDVADTEDLNRTIEEVRKLGPVTSTKTTVVLRQHG